MDGIPQAADQRPAADQQLVSDLRPASDQRPAADQRLVSDQRSASDQTPALPRWTAAHGWTLGVFLVVLAVTWWRPIHPAEQALHHSLTAVALAALLAVQRWRPLPYGSFLLILVFLTLHTIAARWIYSFVPYDDWTDGLFGFRLSEVCGWHRNHFDRLVHLAYGLCLGPVIFRALRGRWAALSAVNVVLSTSALYELFEWMIAMTLAPGAAEAYNGQQGDMWDAHKDMAIATAGAIVGVTIAVLSRRRAKALR